MRLLGPGRLEFVSSASQFSRIPGFRSFWAFEPTKVGRDLLRDSGVRRRSFLDPDSSAPKCAQESALFGACALGIRQLPESVSARFWVPEFRSSVGSFEVSDFWSFGVSEVSKFQTFGDPWTFEASIGGRDFCCDLRQTRMALANSLTPRAGFLEFRAARRPSAPFRAGSLGIRQLHESFFARFWVSEDSKFLNSEGCGI